MAVIEGGTTGAIADVDSTTKAQRVSVRPPDALGHYRLSATTGLLTVVAAGTATVGHLFTFRNSHASTLIVPVYISVKWNTIAGFTAAQEVGFDVLIARNYTTSHTGGTAVSAAGAGGLKKRTGYPTSVLGDARIGTTGALTAGTHTLDAQAMMQNQFAELAAGAAIPKGRFESVWDMTNSGDSPLVLAQNEGIVVRNSILMGAGGTARMTVEVAWFETAAYAIT